MSGPTAPLETRTLCISLCNTVTFLRSKMRSSVLLLRMMPAHTITPRPHGSRSQTFVHHVFHTLSTVIGGQILSETIFIAELDSRPILVISANMFFTPALSTMQRTGFSSRMVLD
ncbi:hypothetical protein TNCV_3126771 [Trichonephila clavipes]|nr:hypothetical protein TNCV_3126771 [Trichonephila clavipes]